MIALPLADLPETDEPSIVYFAKTELLAPPPDENEITQLRDDIRNSERVRMLLAHRKPDGRIGLPAYKKWHGAHWVMAMLGELGYPSGDQTLIPLAEEITDWLIADDRRKWIAHRTRHAGGTSTRVCASIEGNALLALIRLGLLPDRAERLAKSLMSWQWTDGGWNCDKNPAASHSSFMETLIPMRALNAYAHASGDPLALNVVDHAADVFLSRSLFRARATGQVIDPQWLDLHFPCFWHYDILAGLMAMREIGRADDPRCTEARDILLSKRLPGGGWPAATRYYHKNPKNSNFSPVDWGPVGTTRPNPWVTLTTLRVLSSR